MLARMADADDVIKNAGRLFSKLGSTLKETSKTVGGQVKQTAKQVTGLGRGGIKIELDQTRVAPGASLKGRVNLALSEAVSAKRLVVTLRARQRFVTVNRGDSGRSVGSTHAHVYQLDRELAASQTFEGGSFDFDLTVPPDALELKPQPSSGAHPLADVARTVASALTPTAGPIEWQVLAKLEIAWGRDFTSEVDIVVAR
jgi:hypothetical protein